MKHTRAALLTGLTMTAVAAGAFVPAHAADTDVTFTITAAGGLNITAPSTGTLTDTSSGDLTTSGTLSAVEATDQRGALVANWTATVSTTDFVNQTDNTKTIGKANLAYTATPAATIGTGVPVFVPGVFGATNPTVTYAGVGNSEVSWTPDLTLTIPNTAPVGQYKATITHSVA